MFIFSIGCSSASEHTEDSLTHETSRRDCNDELIMGYCFRSDPPISTTCTPFLSAADEDNSCQVIAVGVPSTKFPRDCVVDSDCKFSEFGPLCVEGLCSHWGSCESDSDCFDQDINLGCHEIGACALVFE